MSIKELTVGGGIFGLLAIFAAPVADRDNTGQIVSGGTVDIFEIQIGDCFDDQSMYGTDETVELTGVGGVPCQQPHDNEIYAQTQMALTEYPGEDAILKAADKFCFEEFEAYVGTSYQNSILDITYIYPTIESWNQMSDREISCALFDMNLEKLVGSVRGRGI